MVATRTLRISGKCCSTMGIWPRTEPLLHGGLSGSPNRSGLFNMLIYNERIITFPHVYRRVQCQRQKIHCELAGHAVDTTHKKLLRLSAFPGASPKQPWYRRPGWHIYIVSRQSLYLLYPPSGHTPSSEQPGIELPTDCLRGSLLNHRLGGPVGDDTTYVGVLPCIDWEGSWFCIAQLMRFQASVKRWLVKQTQLVSVLPCTNACLHQ